MVDLLGSLGRTLSAMHVLVLNGPNLGRLGAREPEVYGAMAYAEVVDLCTKAGTELGLEVEVRQTDDEAELVGWLHEAADAETPVVLNPAAFTHYSYALHDACAQLTAPLVEVHLTNPAARETFRHTSVVAAAATGTIAGFGPESYALALKALARTSTNRGLPPAEAVTGDRLDVGIRLAGEADVEDFVRIWVDAAVARRQARGVRGVTDAAEVKGLMRARLGSARAYALVLEESGQAAAMSVSMPARENDGAGPGEVAGLAHLSMVAVDPSRWGRGLGGRIVAASVEAARVRGFDRVQLWTQESNAPAQRLYRRHGFVPTGRTKVDDAGEPIGHWVREPTTGERPG